MPRRRRHAKINVLLAALNARPEIPMHRSRRFQFSLTAVLIVVTIAGLLMGFAQSRRSRILRESTELEAHGVRLLWPRGTIGAFWPVIPKDAVLAFNEISPDEFEIGSTRYSLDEANKYWDLMSERLNRLGVEEVLVTKDGKNTNSYVTTQARRGAR